MKNLFTFFYCSLFCVASIAQTTFPVNGTYNKKDIYYVFKNASIHLDYASVIENGTLIIQNEKIVALGDALEIPKGAKTFNLLGKHIYPSMIDPYSDYGMPKISSSKKIGRAHV